MEVEEAQGRVRPRAASTSLGERVKEEELAGSWFWLLEE